MQKANSFGVDPKSPDDPPFNIANEEADRLVELGVAEYCTGEPEKSGSDGGTGKVGTGKIVETLKKSEVKRLNKPTLEGLAKKLGVDLTDAPNNDKRADAIWDKLEKIHAAVVEVEKDVYEVVEEAEIINENGTGGENENGTGGNADGGQGGSEGTDGEDNENGTGGENENGTDGEPPPTVGAEAPVD